MKLFLTGLFVFVMSGAVPLHANAAELTEARVSMLVAGKISVSPEGEVKTFSLDKADTLPAAVTSLLKKSIPHWHFEPPTRDGKVIDLTTPMTIRVVATPTNSERYSLQVSSATFGGNESSDAIQLRKQTIPKYPPDAIRARVSGTVYLIMDINKQGQVTNIAAQQVNLRVKGSSNQMKKSRRMLAKSATSTARGWTFDIPTSGPLAQRDHWIVRYPITYRLSSSPSKLKSEYGRWVAYMPGPKKSIPWLKQNGTANSDADALVPGDVYLVDNEEKLTLKPHG